MSHKRSLGEDRSSHAFRNVNDTCGATQSSRVASRKEIDKGLLGCVITVNKCASCGMSILTSERDGFCCRQGRGRHWPWVRVPHMEDLYMNPMFGELSRVVNSIFCLSVVHSPDDPGLAYTTRRGGKPMMNISGTLHARFMRTPHNCWFIHDATYAQQYSRLRRDGKLLVSRFREILRQSNPGFPFGTLDSIQSTNATICVVAVEEHLSTVYVGQGDFAPPRGLFIVGSRELIDEEDPRWEIFSYPVFHPIPNPIHAWSRSYMPLNAPPWFKASDTATVREVRDAT